MHRVEIQYYKFVKLIYSEKATNIWRYLPADLSFSKKHKINWEISSNFLASSEYINFIYAY